MHHEFLGSFVTFFLAITLWRARPAAAIWLLATAAVVVLHRSLPVRLRRRYRPRVAHARRDLHMSPAVALTCIAVGIFLFGYLEPRGSYAAFSAVQDAGPARFDRIAIHTASGVLIIIGLLGNDRLGRSLATPPFRLLGRLSFPVYLFHFPLLCSLACTTVRAVAANRIATGHTAAGRRRLHAAAHRRRLSVRLRGRGLARLGQPVRPPADAGLNRFEAHPQALPRSVNAFTVPSATSNVVSHCSSITCGGKPPPYQPVKNGLYDGNVGMMSIRCSL